jgi:Flp pilus assembly protein TadG
MLWRGNEGSVSILTALSLTALLGFMGLAIDVGSLRLAKGRLQMAADAAALAGALEISNCGGTANCTNMKTAAQDALTENGFTGSTVLTNCASISATTLTVVVNNGPCALGTADPNKGNTSYVEAVVSQPLPTYFAGLLGITTIQIEARAEATLGGTSVCLLTMGSSGAAIQVNGNTLTVQNCPLYVNSNNSQALSANYSVTAKSISIVGGYWQNGGTISPTPKTGVAAMADPLSTLPVPSYNASSCLWDPNLNTGGTAGPSSPGGTVCYKSLTIGGNATLTSGLYIMTGNLNVNGSGTLTGNNVTFYFAPGAGLNISTSGKLTLTAPTSGTYNGIVIYQDRTNSNSMTMNWLSNTVFNGILYAPQSALQLNGSSQPSVYATLIVSSVTFDQGAVLKDYATINPGSPLAAGSELVQ